MNGVAIKPPEQASPSESIATEAAPEVVEDKISTTEEELEGFHIVKASVRSVTDVKCVVMRDTQSYCGVLLDDNNRKPICQLPSNRSQKYIGLFDQEKNETRHAIESVDDIYGFAEQLKAAVGYYG